MAQEIDNLIHGAAGGAIHHEGARVSRLFSVSIFLTLSLVSASCATKSEQHQPSNAGRSIPDNQTGEQLLLHSFSSWFNENAASMHIQPTATTVPVGNSKSFRVSSTIQRAGEPAGSVYVEVTRPAMTKEKSECSATWQPQCAVEQNQGYMVLSTGDNKNDSDVHGYSIDVHDQDLNLLALATESSRTGPPPLTRSQAISLAIACVNGFN